MQSLLSRQQEQMVLMMDIASQSIRASQEHTQVMSHLGHALSGGRRGQLALGDGVPQGPGGDAPRTLGNSFVRADSFGRMGVGLASPMPESSAEDIAALMSERLDHPTRANAMLSLNPAAVQARFCPRRLRRTLPWLGPFASYPYSVIQVSIIILPLTRS